VDILAALTGAKIPVSSSKRPTVKVCPPDAGVDPAAEVTDEPIDELGEAVVVLVVDLVELLLQAVAAARHSAALPTTICQFFSLISTPP
jgi:hypothetical protein